MSILKRRLCQKTESNEMNTIHLETNSDVVIHGDGTVASKFSAIDSSLNNKAAVNHKHNASDVDSGVLGLTHGGTGANLSVTPSIVVNLETSVGASPFIESPRPGVTGILPISNGGTGVSTLDELRDSLGVAFYTSSVVQGLIILGNVVKIADKEWRVCHIDTSSKTAYLILEAIEETTHFGANNNYSGSIIATKAKTFENSLPSSVTEKLISITIFDVTQKVQIPTHEQMNGGFSYFNSNERRKCTGGNNWYWTSSPYADNSGSAWRVNTDGDFHGNCSVASTNGGFRPFVALRLE